MSESKNSALTPVIIVGGLGLLAWQGFKYFDKAREQREIDKARESGINSAVNIVKSKQRVDSLEQKALFKGVNGYGKIVTSNYITNAKEIIDGLLNTILDKQSGINKYSVKTQPKESKVLNALFETPIDALPKLLKVYAIYTQRSLIDDLQKLSPNNYAKVKALFNVMNKRIK